MGWTTNDIPDQTGRIAVVTGANGGLGLETARALAAAGAHVVMAARNQTKAEAARADIAATVPSASLELVELDLASQASVRAAAGAIVDAHPRIDLLFNNAGVMGIPEHRTADGFEQQLAVNHLGHFTLTALLFPALLAAPAARIVNTTSTARHLGRAIDPDNPHLDGRYGEWRAYGQSKLANLYFTMGLQRRAEAARIPVAALCAHPGLSNTELQATSVSETGGGWSQRFFHGMARWVGMSPADGALPQLRAGLDPEARGGELFAPRWVTAGPPVRRNLHGRSLEVGPTEVLWSVSERETGTTFDVDTLARAAVAR